MSIHGGARTRAGLSHGQPAAANVQWKTMDNAPRVMVSSGDLFMPVDGA
ncbi:hypothetical protein J2W37_002187 [Variovorax paradoxus]|jgi:hypothetical protein|nr:hypothetical protein [Variovorax paradoxus]